MKTNLKCHCGQRILRRDVMQQEMYVRQVGSSYVYIKYRCSRCKKLGEHLVKQDQWEESMRRENSTEVTDTEKSWFLNLGNITLDEMRNFHYALESLNAIPNLLTDE